MEADAYGNASNMPIGKAEVIRSGMQKEQVLCVDDDLNILLAHERLLKKEFVIKCALGGEKALRIFAEEGPFKVVLSDYNMPGMNGMQLLTMIRERSPDSIRILLTGHPDVRTAITAVNEGTIFRFLTKPCPHNQLLQTLRQAFDQFRLVAAEHCLLEDTLRGSVNVLTDVLAMVHPVVFSRSGPVRQCALRISNSLNGNIPEWEMEIAAMLSQIGCITLPAEILRKVYKGEQLSPDQQALYDSHPTTASRLIAAIPRLELVARMIDLHLQPFSAHRAGADPLSERAIFGAEVLRLAIDYDRAVARGRSHSEILSTFAEASGTYNPAMIAVLRDVDRNGAPPDVRSVSVPGLRPGMFTAENIYAADGCLLLGAGLELSESGVMFLRRIAELRGIREPIQVAGSQPASGNRESGTPAS